MAGWLPACCPACLELENCSVVIEKASRLPICSGGLKGYIIAQALQLDEEHLLRYERKVPRKDPGAAAASCLARILSAVRELESIVEGAPAPELREPPKVAHGSQASSAALAEWMAMARGLEEDPIQDESS